MQTLIKRFTQETTDLNLVLISILAAVLSLRLGFLTPVQQFAVVSVIVVSEISVISYLFLGREPFNEVFASAQILLILLSSSTFLVEVAAAFGIVSTGLAFFHSSSELSMYIKAILAHTGDAATTYLILENPLGEANPVMQYLMSNLGIFSALVVSKLFLVGLPLLFSYRSFEQFEQQFFIKAVIILGVSLTVRNLIIVF